MGTLRGCDGPAGSRNCHLAPRGLPSSRSGASGSVHCTASPTAGAELPPPLSPSYARPAATSATASAATAAASGTCHCEYFVVREREPYLLPTVGHFRLKRRAVHNYVHSCMFIIYNYAQLSDASDKVFLGSWPERTLHSRVP